MTKQEAINLFGSISKLAKALGVTPAAISQWPPEISLQKQDQIRGACVRHNKPITIGSELQSRAK